jgi:hypothetical protein
MFSISTSNQKKHSFMCLRLHATKVSKRRSSHGTHIRLTTNTHYASPDNGVGFGDENRSVIHEDGNLEID